MLYIRMASLNIECVRTSRPKNSPEVDEYVEMNAFILMSFSSDDALSSKSRKQMNNRPRVEISTLGVGEECIAKFPRDCIWHCVLVAINIIYQDTGTQGHSSLL